MPPLAALKKATDALKVNVREEMRRLHAYYRNMGKCWLCKRRLFYTDYDMSDRQTGWRIRPLAAGASGPPGAREVPLCVACEAAAEPVARAV